MLNQNIKNLVFFDIFFATGDFKEKKEKKINTVQQTFLGKKTIS
jgi:hypothetical protein